MSGKGPLAGLRVADFTWIGAGSYTTKILADFGAEVIKVETSTHLDPLRYTAPFFEGKSGVNRSGYFADRNSSKRSMMLNLKMPEAQEVARELIAKSDIVANNFSPGTMEKFGLGYDQVSATRKELVYLAMSMQGATGPHSRYVGFGLTIAALSGIQFLSGPADRAPVGTGTNYPDHLPNPCHAAFAVLAAVYHQRKTGIGQFIDFSQTEPTTALMGPALLEFSANKHIAQRAGNDNTLAAPRGAYPCRQSRSIAISVATDQQWAALDDLLSLRERLPAEDWSTASTRMAHRPQLDRALAEATIDWDAKELENALQARGIAAGVALNIAELVDEDPQLAHRGHWIKLDHPEMGRTTYNAPPMRLSRTSFTMDVPAPLLGQHTEEVCQKVLGMNPARMSQLRELGVFN